MIRRTWSRLVADLERRLQRVQRRRSPDFIVGGDADPYLLRWFLTPWRELYRAVPAEQRSWWQRAARCLAGLAPNLYLHRFLRSDDDRALHDHPWFWCSLLLRGEYTEHTIAAGGVHRRRIYRAGSLRIHGPWFAHRIELHAGPCTTLFLVVGRCRTWGFHCPNGWRPWQVFTDPATKGATVGRGCD